MASTLRDVSLSIHYRLLQLLLQRGWTTTSHGVAFEELGAGSNVYVPAARNFPWVFMDTSGALSLAGVTVYDGGDIVSPDDIQINCMRQTVTFQSPPAGPVTADFTAWSVNVREGYPESTVLENASLPIVAYQVEGETGEAFAVGSAAEWEKTPVVIDILAPNDGIRPDLMHDIRKGIQYLPIYDFSEHLFLAADGSVNTTFDPTEQIVCMGLFRGKPRGSLLRPKFGATPKERFPALVTFEVEKIA